MEPQSSSGRGQSAGLRGLLPDQQVQEGCDGGSGGRGQVSEVLCGVLNGYVVFVDGMDCVSYCYTQSL